jgi:hypothetical protein
VTLPSPVFDAGEVRLVAGLVYGGRLLDRNGRPAAGVVVGLHQEERQQAESPPSAADGSFAIALPPGLYLGALFAGDRIEFVKPPVLEPRARGRLFLPVDAVPEGLQGKHEVVLQERPVAIRLRVVDDATDRPVPGASVSLWRGTNLWGWNDLYNPDASIPVDEAATDDDGVVAHLWPLGLKRLAVRIREKPGRVTWTVLDRPDAEGMVPREVRIPREPVLLVVRCLDAATKAPVPGTEVVATTNAFSFRGVTDGKGEARWTFTASDTMDDPSALEVIGWGATWRDAAGNPRKAFSYDVCHPLLVPARPDAEESDLVPNGPLEILLRPDADPGLWVCVKPAPGETPPRPQFLQIEAGLTQEAYAIFCGQFTGVYADASGRSVWWTWESGMPETLKYVPADRKVKAELKLVDRPSLFLEVDRARVLAARRIEDALVFEAKPLDVMSRTLRVVLADGKPAAGALVIVLAGAAPASSAWEERERERTATGADGIASLVSLDPGGDHRILAWDPATGAGGLLVGPDQAAPPEKWRLALEAPRELRVKVRFAGGATMAEATVSLAPYSTAFPLLPNVSSKDGEVVVPGVPLPLYAAWVFGRGSGNDYRMVWGTSASFAGKDVVLEKAKR